MSEPNTQRPSTPIWVKALAVGVVLVIAALFAVMLLSGGAHGPWQHGF